MLQVIDEVDKDGKTPLMWAALRAFKYVCGSVPLVMCDVVLVRMYMNCHNLL